MIGSIKNFVNRHITASGNDFQPNEEAQRVDREYADIQDTLSDVSDDLGRIDEETKVKEVSLKNFSDKSLLIGGAAGGAAFGAAVYLGKETIASLNSSTSVEVVKTQNPVFRTEFADGSTPWREQISERMSGGLITGWDHSYEPILEKKEIGTYETQEAVVKDGRNYGMTGMIGQAAAYAAVGGVVGLAVAGATVAARKAVPEWQHDGSEPRKTSGDIKNLVAFGAKGALLGAGAGAVAGLIESRHNGVQTIVNESPVLKTETIGHMPQPWFESTTSTTPGGGDLAPYEVQNPETGLLGGLKTTETKTQVEVTGRYGMLEGAIGGAIVGGAAGVAFGVLTNVVRKSI